jgi:hypothetical protein
MKNFALLSILALASGQVLARQCAADMNGNKNYSTRCEISVTSTTVSECHILRAGGRFPEDYKPIYHVHPWDRTRVESNSEVCGIDMQTCQDLAFRALEKFEFTNNCGDVYVGESVDYKLQSLNRDGTVADETAGRMRK